MAYYIGPTTSINHILCKLSDIFGIVALFNVLMQNFYKVRKGNNEKVTLFSTRLEGTINQIQLQCPGRMIDLEALQHLRDSLFHEVIKHIHDSVWYLYSTSGILYSQLMVAAWKERLRAKMKKLGTRWGPRPQWPLSQWRVWLSWNNRSPS